MLLFVGADGSVRNLSGDKDPRLAYTSQHAVPAISLVEDGEAVAGFVEHWQGGSGVALYDLGGLRREYRFGVHDPFPPKLREVGPGWQFIICTRDGKRALFQERPDPRGRDRDRTGPWWVYTWDLEKQTYEPIAQMSEIEYCFGWLSDTALIVGAQAQDAHAAAQGLCDYGVLHLTNTAK